MAYLPYYLGAYLLGSIPFGWLIARAKGVNIRDFGSGNIGATNVGRALGKPYAAIVFILDFGKGFLPVWIARAANLPDWGLIAVAAIATLGHVFPVWLRFKGGKGIATGAGAMAALLPIPLAIAVAVWLILFYITRYVSVASLAAAAALPISTAFVRPTVPYLVFTILLALLAFFTHRSNIGALIRGTEHRFDNKKASAS
ncbi:MAG TPA: glycerol-3-phosphate 1-O-acyltransferase PlsY [Sphingomonadales bacterium]|nr:glycerol-3-phosphate 1-O-acyltransferase PlsY [Sphingomonadales bacterium]